MKTIHVLRKPCSEGTVAANVLAHGTGAMNIDGCRVGTGGDKGEWPITPRTSGLLRLLRERGSMAGPMNPATTDQSVGRWPANLMLQHLDGCHMVGTATVLGDSRTSDYSPRQSGMFNVGQVKSDGRPRGTLHGDQTVPVYDCAPGCPVAALDAQSGDRPVSGAAKNGRPATMGTAGEGWGTIGSGGNGVLHADTGGASRYFKQFVGSVRSEE